MRRMELEQCFAISVKVGEVEFITMVGSASFITVKLHIVTLSCFPIYTVIEAQLCEILLLWVCVSVKHGLLL